MDALLQNGSTDFYEIFYVRIYLVGMRINCKIRVYFIPLDN